ncbi:MAG: hypothetical protein KJ549_00985, partial [Alphaproteobacteria bacterium]|nr:hypothetical protein [Alphaproteobacteria bacterium]MBU1463041.1 hypothetical protein [Alphaproteobacteria bacterium]
AKGRAKMRDLPALNDALETIGSKRHEGAMTDDHGADAILTAAWMRAVAGQAGLWTPAALDPKIAATEGWTFGVI